VDSLCVSFHNDFLTHHCTNSVPFVPQVAPMLSSSIWIFKQNLARSIAVQQYNSTNYEEPHYVIFSPSVIYFLLFILPSTTVWNTTSLRHSPTARDPSFRHTDMYKTKRNITFFLYFSFLQFHILQWKTKDIELKGKSIFRIKLSLNLFVIQHPKYFSVITSVFTLHPGFRVTRKRKSHSPHGFCEVGSML